MKIIVGLGNPGKEYERTKHNLGFMFLDYLNGKLNLGKFKKFKSSEILESNINGEKVILAKPQTFMNLSGKAVVELKQFYKVESKDILIVYDDFDILFGSVRFREKGSAGTHNGMKDIIQKTSSVEIPRLRIGTGGLKKENEPIISFVLSKFSKSNLDELNNIFEQATIKFEEFLDK